MQLPSLGIVQRLRTESGSALLLVAVTIVALVWANSPWSHFYTELWETHMGISLGDFSVVSRV
ncbi:Na(+)/H(+) antiporter NhaA [Corynebacterium atrinae]|uniref:Na+/H+ antiporter NhaA n=1 Tax=Corynebacterium atrinae TaxID=1336740 RepID=UPI0025B47823|nr:Na+/H+ antiporter NhaA [Corynebacterium atrinae]WJY62754.1 Na(+)/H(+) antiporter NhaA [Corynebacterium atrinae]